MAVTPDGRQVWVSAGNFIDPSSPGYVDVFDATTHAQYGHHPRGGGPFFMVLARDGRFAYVADKESCDLREIDTATFQVVATVEGRRAVLSD